MQVSQTYCSYFSIYTKIESLCFIPRTHVVFELCLNKKVPIVIYIHKSKCTDWWIFKEMDTTMYWSKVRKPNFTALPTLWLLPTFNLSPEIITILNFDSIYSFSFFSALYKCNQILYTFSSDFFYPTFCLWDFSILLCIDVDYSFALLCNFQLCEY